MAAARCTTLLVLTALLLTNATAAAATSTLNFSRRSLIPVRIRFEESKRAHGGKLKLHEMTVSLCAFNWDDYRRDPTLTPMFRDLTVHSACGEKSGNVVGVTFGDLEAEYLGRGCAAATTAAPDASGCRPTGLIFHESRCGSTMATNMLAVASKSLVYSEPGFYDGLLRLLQSGAITREEYTHALRVLYAALARPIWAASNVFPIEGAGPDSIWRPRYMFVKLGYTAAPQIGMYQSAFPATPWVFMYRNGVEVIMSLLRNAPLVPAGGGGSPGDVIVDNAAVAALSTSPCLRERGTRRVSLFALKALGVAYGAATAKTPAETFCAVSVAELVSSALSHAREARAQALAPLWVLADLKTASSNAVASSASFTSAFDESRKWADGATVATVIRASAKLNQLLEVDAAHGALLDKATHRGIVNGIGQAVFVDYHGGAARNSSSEHNSERALSATLLALFQGHLAPTPGWLSSEDAATMLAWSTRYSKARGATMDGATGEVVGGRSRTRGAKPSLDSQGNYVADSDTKLRKAWPALREATAKYVSPLEVDLRWFNVREGGGLNELTAAAAAPAAAAAVEAVAELTGGSGDVLPTGSIDSKPWHRQLLGGAIPTEPNYREGGLKVAAGGWITDTDTVTQPLEGVGGGTRAGGGGAAPILTSLLPYYAVATTVILIFLVFGRGFGRLRRPASTGSGGSSSAGVSSSFSSSKSASCDYPETVHVTQGDSTANGKRW